MAAWTRTIGAALGAIIATIITHHIRKTSAAYAADQTTGGIAMPGIWIAIRVMVSADTCMPTPAMV